MVQSSLEFFGSILDFFFFIYHLVVLDLNSIFGVRLTRLGVSLIFEGRASDLGVSLIFGDRRTD